jgi:translation elongation factor EF-4
VLSRDVEASADGLTNWLDVVNEAVGAAPLFKALLINKVDLTPADESFLAQLKERYELDAGYFCSAKTGEGVKESIEDMVDRITTAAEGQPRRLTSSTRIQEPESNYNYCSTF